ncbi:sigma-54-dependent Fis family transcriptional regulator [Archangium violaceum]|uniref:sigma-54-dependent transcriptional regulator n=1 Tax=Archangium violaceum TaxID=83451 RepID=UPI00194E87F1|nr:sigma 54-interacting transcriptional regulator [Archangium violaceum]QRN93331.1 sigma-54-dependent Fis family transcriptional regulator [Archangium violaceum]
MQDPAIRLMVMLMETGSFEEAANATLRVMLELTEQALAATRYGRHGRIIRGMIHLRPEEGYRGLAVLEAGAAARPSGAAGKADGTAGMVTPLLASATAWQLMVEHRCAISIDVNLGLLTPHMAGAAPLGESELGPAGRAFNSAESQQRFLGRQATHVGVLPLLGPGRVLHGMISLEAECPAATGQEFIWRECGERLQLLASQATPYLIALPPRPSEQAGDKYLPVVGASLASLLPALKVFARQEETLLISGPTGVGKSRLARWCHEQSSRQREAFEVLDLMTVPEDLQMAELFGWKKGAFTGAVRDNPGAMTRAEGGTLFIDEIDKLSLKAQAGLLHVLEERTYRMLGENGAERRADVRFIIGTNANLQTSVRAGRFREDLYYRIKVLPIALPALKDRQDEIARWARYMADRRHRERYPEGQVRLTGAAERLLTTQPWPGNLRQLDNIVRRAYALALVDSGETAQALTLEVHHFQQSLSYESDPAAQPLTEVLSTAARAFVSEAQARGPGAIDLDLADSFRGFVLAVATRRLGRDEAFRLFGRESLIKSRNHSRTLRREVERLEALYKALGLADCPFSDLVEGGSDSEG